MKAKYPKEYFSVQLQFAIKLSEILSKPLDHCIYNYTGLTRELIQKSPDDAQQDDKWKNFVVKILQNSDDLETTFDLTYEFYKKQSHSNKIGSSPPFGSFDYNLQDEGKTVNLHFTNGRKEKRGDLASKYIDERKNELKELFEDVQKNHPQVTHVKVSAWLLNYDAFTRLFPKEVKEQMKSIGTSTYIGIWQQFLNSEGNINKERYNEFLKKLDSATSLEEAINAFLFHVFEVKLPIGVFYKYYNIT